MIMSLFKLFIAQPQKPFEQDISMSNPSLIELTLQKKKFFIT